MYEVSQLEPSSPFVRLCLFVSTLRVSSSACSLPETVLLKYRSALISCSMVTLEALSFGDGIVDVSCDRYIWPTHTIMLVPTGEPYTGGDLGYNLVQSEIIQTYVLP